MVLGMACFSCQRLFFEARFYCSSEVVYEKWQRGSQQKNRGHRCPSSRTTVGKDLIWNVDLIISRSHESNHLKPLFVTISVTRNSIRGCKHSVLCNNMKYRTPSFSEKFIAPKVIQDANSQQIFPNA